jgi:hypothetical protein
MNCPNCGKQIPDTAKVCGYCGTRLQAPVPTKTRPAPPAPKVEPAVPTPAPEQIPEPTPKPKPQQVRKAPAARPAAPKPRASRQVRLPGWAWGVIGGLVILTAVFVLASMGTVFVPYITQPPGPVKEVLSGARVVSHNDFSSLPASLFEYDDRYVTLSNGVAEISGNDYDWPYIAYRNDTGIREGHAVLVSFEYSAGAWWTLSFLSGSYDTSRHRAWGITEEMDKYTVKVSEWYDVERMPGNLSLGPNTWYSLLLAVDDGPEFLAHLWERDDPRLSTQIRQSFSGDLWDDRGWVFWIASIKGKLYIDEITEMTFDGLK